MRIPGLLLPLLACGMGLSPAWAQETIPLRGDPLKGRVLFVAKGCVRCHSIWGAGGTLGPELTRIGQGRSLLQLAGLLWNHSPRMLATMQQEGVPRPTFTPEEMGDLIAYLYYLNYFDEPGDFRRGEILFQERHCIACHSVGALPGGSVGPRLDVYGRFRSPIAVAQAMWNHGPAMARKALEQGIPLPTFEGGEMADILAYLRGVTTAGEAEPVYTEPGDPAEGQRLFTEKGCVRCHSVRGAGGKVAPDLGRVEMARTVTQVAGVMWNHGAPMWSKMRELGIPPIRFSGNEMADIVAYLYFIRYFDEPGDAAVGRALFRGKGCQSCHAPEAGQRAAGPDLATSAALASPISLASSLWNHAPTMEETLQRTDLPWPRFEGNEMRDLVAYLRTLPPNTPR